MKVKALCRSRSSTTRSSVHDLRPTHKNLDPAAHPQGRAREYARAVGAAKLDRMFAKPLLGELKGGHVDAVSCLAVCRTNLCPVVSGCVDGTVRIWDLQSRKMVASLEAHSRGVSGLAFGNGVEGMFYSCGEEGVVKAWSIFPRGRYVTAEAASSGDENSSDDEDGDGKKPKAKRKRSYRSNYGEADDGQESPHGPHNIYRLPSSRHNAHGSNAFHSIDHHWTDSQFATASSDAAVHLWDPQRSTPISTFKDLWGSDDTVTTLRYNPAETDLIAHCSNDRGVGLHDTRTSSALKKTIMSMRCNCLEWNPMEPYMFVVGNEDYNAYTFDMRKLERPTSMYKGHVGAVMCVAWSPTGTEFVTGSYDRTLRLFSVRREGGTQSHAGSHSTGVARDVYHAKRMQRVFCVGYTSDHKYVLSGSDDTNLRLWKARSSEKIKQLSVREEASLQYRKALVQKYAHLPEVRRISRSRRVPAFVKKQTAMATLQKEKRRRKEGNVVKHSKPGTQRFTDEKAKAIVKTVD